MRFLLALLTPCVVFAVDAAPPRTLFDNTGIWPDTAGVHINAHGGGVIFHDGAYYWFGEHKGDGKDGDLALVGVHVYRSTDLLNWTDAGVALAVSEDPASDIVRGCILERPKVIYNPTTRTFVMWFHLELKGQGYRAARVGVAVSDSATGPYRFLRSMRANPGVAPVNAGDDADPNALWRRDLVGGQMSRDMTLFQDDDGKAYHITSAEDNQTLHVHELSEDFCGYSGRWARILPRRGNEAPAMVKHAGRYWLLSSGCSGWAPNTARSWTATRIFGPWTELGNPGVGYSPSQDYDETKTWGGQGTCIIPVHGRPDMYIACFDRWRFGHQVASSYYWLPMVFTADRFIVPWMERWSLDSYGALPVQPSIGAPATGPGPWSIPITGTAVNNVIRYTTDGSVPTVMSAVAVDGRCTIAPGTRLMAIAESHGVCSSIATRDFPAIAPPVPPVPQIFLDNLKPTEFTSDKSMKIGLSYSGNPLSLDGQVFATGLGVHAQTRLAYALDPAWRQFVATVGLDDQAPKHGSVVVVVRLDGRVVDLSPVLTPSRRRWAFQVPLPAGAKELAIVVEHARDGFGGDHTDLVDAGFIAAPADK